MEMEFAESLYVCFVLVVCFFAGYGIVNLIGLAVLKATLCRRTGKRKWWMPGRCV